MTTALHRFDSLLRMALSPQAQENAALKFHTCVVLVVCGGALQGAAMGCFPLINGGSFLFLVFSAIKVPLFLGLTAALTLPAMRVLYTVLGLAHEFPRVVRVLAGMQMIYIAILASLSPLTVLAYVSGLPYRGALIWNVGLFAMAAAITRQVVRAQLAHLVQSDPRHFRLWQFGLGIWAFVAVQLAWNLRPFIGSPLLAPQFFRPDAFTNAYVALLKILVG